MENNPFNSEKFQSIWLKYFQNANSSVSFKSIKKAKFYEDKKLSLYVNVGKNITNGSYYEIDDEQIDYRKKLFLIYDVPTYFNVESDSKSGLKLKKAKQYSGLGINLSTYKSFDDYFQFKFKSKSRYRYNRNRKRLEACFDIKYEKYYGEISKEEYDHIFKYLILNISTRFGELNLDNDILSKKEYYYELIYELIIKKEAVLVVIYDNDLPISISFNFLSEKVVFFAITTFNTDYYRYDLGHTNIMVLLQWCFDNGFEILDFSKGKSEYKSRWSNFEYDFEQHILYDSNSLKSRLYSTILSNFFVFKQYLRNKKFNKIYSKIRFKYKQNSSDTIKKDIQIDDLSNTNLDYDKLEQVDLRSKEYKHLLKPLYTYLYNSPEKINKIKIYKHLIDTDSYFAIGEINKLKINI